ncbi:hypothetical protein EGW08_004532 [Elysia chlorotica]|uniref:Uncharacterized protein n=1 Tax=Elysia chlorotica TaxID=188477 RepID=A0A3S1ABN4_ELYCH|nr:hypothetical protein EGW08_004532 [Elysia chlorotica]
MQIEDIEYEENSDSICFFCCFCCKEEVNNPDLNKNKHDYGWFIKKPYTETGYLVPIEKRQWGGKTLKSLREKNPVTCSLPSPEESILISNGKKAWETDVSSTGFAVMNVADVNNLLRRRLSLCLHVTEEDQTGERGEALLPQMSTFSEATPYLLSHLVKETPNDMQRHSLSLIDSSTDGRRGSLVKLDIERFRSSKEFEYNQMHSMENVSDNDFLESLVKTSNFIREALEKDWPQTKNYVKWLENHVKSSKFMEKASKHQEKWMVVLYTSSEGTLDELTNFRCMLVRLLLQHHCIVYEERDVQLPQFQEEFQERLEGDKLNIPQVYMQGLNIGGYRVMYAIHKQKLAGVIFQKFIISPQEYGNWMFSKESNKANLTLDVNLKAFPALQALAGSWTNDKLLPHHLEFVTLGKLVVKHARETWYMMSTQPHTEPDLRRYALLRLTIIQALIAMNKVYKQYVNKIEQEAPNKMRRKLSWLPRLSKQIPKD